MLPHGDGAVNPAARRRYHTFVRVLRVACSPRGRDGVPPVGGTEASRGRMIEDAIPTLVLIGVAAVLAPIIAEGTRRFLPVPEVVIQILLGILIGPYVLALAHTDTPRDGAVRFRPHLSDVPGRHRARPGGHAPGTPRAGGRLLGCLPDPLPRCRGRAARDRPGPRLGRGGALPDHHRAHDVAPHPARRRRAAHGDRADHPVGGRLRGVRSHRRGGRPAHEPRRPA